MKEITISIFRKCFPNGKDADLLAYYPHILRTIDEFRILKVPEYFATLAHESGSFHYAEEIASGEAYEGRKDLGNTQPGDGVKYKGRGPVQITGKSNYAMCGKALHVDLLAKPEILILPEYGSLATGWFWNYRKLDFCNDFLEISIKVNGRNKKTGLPNGWNDRIRHLQRIRPLLT